MDLKDVELLMMMQKEVSQPLQRQLFDLASGLESLRDHLSFDDDAWYLQLTYHIVTLDSAGSWTPGSEEDARRKNLIVELATNEIGKLIKEKLSFAGG